MSMASITQRFSFIHQPLSELPRWIQQATVTFFDACR